MLVGSLRLQLVPVFFQPLQQLFLLHLQALLERLQQQVCLPVQLLVLLPQPFRELLLVLHQGAHIALEDVLGVAEAVDPFLLLPDLLPQVFDLHQDLLEPVLQLVALVLQRLQQLPGGQVEPVLDIVRTAVQLGDPLLHLLGIDRRRVLLQRLQLLPQPFDLFL